MMTLDLFTQIISRLRVKIAELVSHKELCCSLGSNPSPEIRKLWQGILHSSARGITARSFNCNSSIYQATQLSGDWREDEGNNSACCNESLATWGLFLLIAVLCFMLPWRPIRRRAQTGDALPLVALGFCVISAHFVHGEDLHHALTHADCGRGGGGCCPVAVYKQPSCANTSSHPVTVNEEICIIWIIISECKVGWYLSIGCVCCWTYVNLSTPCALALAWSRSTGFCALSLLSRSTLWLLKLHSNLMTARLPTSWCQSEPSSGISLITLPSFVKRKM